MGILLLCLILWPAAQSLPFHDNDDNVFTFSSLKNDINEGDNTFDLPALSDADLIIIHDSDQALPATDQKQMEDLPALSDADLIIVHDSDEGLPAIDQKQMEDQVWTQAATRLIEVLQDTRSKLDESRPASVTDERVSVESKSGDAEAPQASSDPDDETKSVQGAETPDLNKRMNEDDEESHDTTEENVLSNPFLDEDAVFVHSEICTNIDCKGGQLRLPFEPYMSVHRAILLAAANFKEHNKDVVDRLNPFNSVFAWNNRKSCYVIKELLKQKSRHNGHWDITVITIEGKTRYQDKCLPFEGDFTLQPNDMVFLYHPWIN